MRVYVSPNMTKYQGVLFYVKALVFLFKFRVFTINPCVFYVKCYVIIFNLQVFMSSCMRCFYMKYIVFNKSSLAVCFISRKERIDLDQFTAPGEGLWLR